MDVAKKNTFEPPPPPFCIERHKKIPYTQWSTIREKNCLQLADSFMRKNVEKYELTKIKYNENEEILVLNCQFAKYLLNVSIKTNSKWMWHYKMTFLSKNYVPEQDTMNSFIYVNEDIG